MPCPCTVPPPATDTLSVADDRFGVNVALTERLSDISTTQPGAETLHAPLQPENE